MVGDVKYISNHRRGADQWRDRRERKRNGERWDGIEIYGQTEPCR
jgi:hypothetical protein